MKLVTSLVLLALISASYGDQIQVNTEYSDSGCTQATGVVSYIDSTAQGGPCAVASSCTRDSNLWYTAKCVTSIPITVSENHYAIAYYSDNNCTKFNNMVVYPLNNCTQESSEFWTIGMCINNNTSIQTVLTSSECTFDTPQTYTAQQCNGDAVYLCPGQKVPNPPAGTKTSGSGINLIAPILTVITFTLIAIL